MKVVKFNEWVLEESESDVFYYFINEFYHSDLITDNERFLIERKIENISEYLIKENFFNKLKSGIDKAKNIAKDVNDKGKQALKKIVDAAKEVTDFITKIKNYLSSEIEKILTNTKNKLKEKLSADKNFTNKIKEMLSSDEQAVLRDIKTIGEVVSFYRNKLKDSLLNKVTEGLKSFFSNTNKEMSVSEKLEFIKESDNVISKLVHGLNKIPPFSWLEKVAHIGEKGTEKIISALSGLTKNLGGPEFTLPIIATIMGIAFEYNIKGLAKHGLIEVTSFFSIPFVGTLIKSIAFIATLIAVYEIFELIIKKNEK
jgi:hypothetical protein